MNRTRNKEQNLPGTLPKLPSTAFNVPLDKFDAWFDYFKATGRHVVSLERKPGSWGVTTLAPTIGDVVPEPA